MAEQSNNKQLKSDKKWHLDKRVSITHLIMTAAMVGAAALWLLRLEGRVDLVDLRDVQMNNRIEQISVRLKLAEAEIIRRLERIEDKLDAHISHSEKRN
jgi:hypothetical protein